MLFELVLEIVYVGLPLALAVVHLSVEALAGGGHEGSIKFVLFPGDLLDFAQPRVDDGELGGLQGQTSLLGGAKLVLDIDRLGRAR